MKLFIQYIFFLLIVFISTSVVKDKTVRKTITKRTTKRPNDVSDNGPIKISDNENKIPQILKDLKFTKKEYSSFNKLKQASIRKSLKSYREKALEFFESYGKLKTNGQDLKILKVEFDGKQEDKESSKPIINQQIFESLQQYSKIFEKHFNTEESDNKQQIHVKMSIGGEIRSFIIKNSKYKNMKKQAFITTDNDDYPGTPKTSMKSETYKAYASSLDSNDGYDKETAKMLIKARARLILDAIKQPAGEQENWKEASINHNGKQIKIMNAAQIRFAVKILATTQVAESVPPDDAFFNKLLQYSFEDLSKKLNFGPGERSGRIPGADKLARAAFKLIANGDLTFSEMFGSNAKYTPALKEGTELTRKLLVNAFSENTLLDNMSDPSDFYNFRN